ncbi:MAG: diguanylate cyclase [Planctomycetes bacterium]|nr:diguanylate cyclase [Planctomycetota bacterium]
MSNSLARNKENNADIHHSRLLDMLKQLLAASKAGDFSIALDDRRLPGEEGEAVRLLNEAIANYRAAAEYDLMKYKLVRETMGIAMWDMDIRSADPASPSNQLTWSQELRHLLGFSDEHDFPNLLHSWSERLHPDDKERALQALEAHLNDYTGETPYDIEYQLMLKNGQYSHFRAFGATLRDGKGVPLRMAGALMDIIEQKHVEEALLMQHERIRSEQEKSEAQTHWYKSILDSVPLPISITDLDMNWTFVNRAAEEFLGAKLEDMIGKSCSNCGIPICNTSDCGIARLEQGVTRTYFNYNDKSYLADTAVLKDLDGNPSGFIEAMQDISEIRKMTQIIQKSVEQLQHREMLMTALNQAATAFLTQNEESLEKIMGEGIKPIAQTVNVNRLFVWRNDLKKDGLHAKQIYRWSDQEGGADEPPLELTDFLYSRLVPRWEELLANGEAINSPLRLLPEAKVLEPLGAKSVFVAPIFVHDVFWGVALFADVHQEHCFSGDCAEMLRSAAFLLANTVIRAEMEKEIAEQTHLMQTVNLLSSIMLQSHADRFERDLFHSLGIIAKTVAVDRVHIWKNHYQNEDFRCSQIYEWSEDAEAQQNSKPAVEELFRDIIPVWGNLLSQGLHISGIVREMSEYEKMALQPQGILSILIVPIFSKNKFWGFIGFYDCRWERLFSEKEELILRSAGQLFVNSLIRNEEEAKTNKAEERLRVITEASPVSYILFNNNLQPVDCNNEALRVFACSEKKDFLDNYWTHYSPEFQPDGQRSMDKSEELRKKMSSREKITYEWTHKTLAGEILPMQNTLTQIKYQDEIFFVSFKYDLRNIRKMEENIHWLEGEAEKIYYDALTGIYNRRYFDENLKRILKFLSHSGGMLSLMLIDIDYFKNYNDSYGHGEGDNCLKIIADTISRSVTRPDDFVARYGGEEFAIVLPNTDNNGARVIADKLLENVRERNLPHRKSTVADRVTVSIGATTGRVKHTHSGEDYIKQADILLYQSKQHGRNRYTFAPLADLPTS